MVQRSSCYRRQSFLKNVFENYVSGSLADNDAIIRILLSWSYEHFNAVLRSE